MNKCETQRKSQLNLFNKVNVNSLNKRFITYFIREERTHDINRKKQNFLNRLWNQYSKNKKQRQKD